MSVSTRTVLLSLASTHIALLLLSSLLEFRNLSQASVPASLAPYIPLAYWNSARLEGFGALWDTFVEQLLFSTLCICLVAFNVVPWMYERYCGFTEEIHLKDSRWQGVLVNVKSFAFYVCSMCSLFMVMLLSKTLFCGLPQAEMEGFAFETLLSDMPSMLLLFALAVVVVVVEPGRQKLALALGCLAQLLLCVFAFTRSLLALRSYPEFPFSGRGKAVLRLVEHLGFPSSQVVLEHSSSEAYFMGFGSWAVLAVGGELAKMLSGRELVALVAHELGHWQYLHSLLSFCVLVVGDGLVALTVLLLISRPGFYKAFGFPAPGGSGKTVPLGAGLVLAHLLCRQWHFFFTVLDNGLGHQKEYAADRYATALGHGPDLISALVRMFREDNDVPIVSWLYNCLFDSHPDLSRRITALR